MTSPEEKGNELMANAEKKLKSGGGLLSFFGFVYIFISSLLFFPDPDFDKSCHIMVGIGNGTLLRILAITEISLNLYPIGLF